MWRIFVPSANALYAPIAAVKPWAAILLHAAETAGINAGFGFRREKV